MKPLFLFCLCLLLGTAPARAQFLWQTAVGTATHDETADLMIPVAGGFVTAGVSINRAQRTNQGLYLSKVNYTGDTVWTKRIRFRQVQVLYSRGLIVDAAGNLVVSLITAAPGVPAPPRQGLLVKLTALGDTLWTRAVVSPGNVSALATLVPGNDGSYVAIGDLGLLPALFKFSPTGVLLWTQIVTYSSTRQGYLYNLVAVPNGYLVVSTPGAGLRSKYITVDETGAYQFERFGYVTPPARLQRDSQGNLLAIGGSLTKLTVQGDSLWSYSYQQYGRALNLSRLVELPNGRYLAAGTRYNTLDYDLGLLLVDRNGTRLRDTLLVRYQSNENAAGLALTPAGHYVVALGTDNGPLGGDDQYLFAYRNWDRLLPTRAAQAAPLARLAAYPNPTTDAVTLEAADGRPLTGAWTLYDLLGRAVQTGTLPGLPRARCSLAGLPAGIYLLRVSDPNRHTTQTLRLEKHELLIL